MKWLPLLVLILSATTHLKAQSSQICFTREEVILLHKQQIRLKYCDSNNVLLSRKVEALEKVIEAQEHSLVVRSEENQMNIEHNQYLKEQFRLSETERLKLVKRNRLMKYGLLGLGGTSILLTAIVIAK